jgi:DNA-binding IclR family transcriptional regulator
MAKPIRAIVRAIDVLTYLNKHNGANSNQVSLGIKLSRGTTYRMLETFEGAGLVERRPNGGGGYWLTDKVQQLSAGFDDESWIAAVALPEMRLLCKSIVWPVMLTTPRETEMLLRATTDASSPFVRNRYVLGHTVPMLGSATGRCYLAHLPQAQYEATIDLIARIAPEPWCQIAGDRQALDQMRREVRERGVALAQTPEGSTMSLAVPILIDQQPSAILAARFYISAMTAEEGEARLASPLKATAGRISDQLARVAT